MIYSRLATVTTSRRACCSASSLLRSRVVSKKTLQHSRAISSVTTNTTTIPTLSHNVTSKSTNDHDKKSSTRLLAASLAAAAATLAVTTTTSFSTNCSTTRRSSANADVLMLSPQKEPSTGILFPRLCNGMTFAGCGVRVKWRFVKVYAVGTYVDPLSMMAVKKQGDDAIEAALLDPKYPRTLRIVMNRSLSIEKYTAAIVEALEPRMKGEDLDKLEEFKKLNPSIDLIEGAEMEMTIRGDTMLYKNAVGGVGMIQSAVFCQALCDVYYGADAVSPSHKEDVIKGVKGL